MRLKRRSYKRVEEAPGDTHTALSAICRANADKHMPFCFAEDELNGLSTPLVVLHLFSHSHTA